LRRLPEEVPYEGKLTLAYLALVYLPIGSQVSHVVEHWEKHIAVVEGVIGCPKDPLESLARKVAVGRLEIEIVVAADVPMAMRRLWRPYIDKSSNRISPVVMPNSAFVPISGCRYDIAAIGDLNTRQTSIAGLPGWSAGAALVDDAGCSSGLRRLSGLGLSRRRQA
jgi:hypothetical protein